MEIPYMLTISLNIKRQIGKRKHLLGIDVPGEILKEFEKDSLQDIYLGCPLSVDFLVEDFVPVLWYYEPNFSVGNETNLREAKNAHTSRETRQLISCPAS